MNYIRHVSTMPRQTTQKAKREGKGSKGKNVLSHKGSNIRNNPNEETSMKSSSAVSSSRYNGSDHIRKSVSTTSQSSSTLNNTKLGSSKG